MFLWPHHLRYVMVVLRRAITNLWQGVKQELGGGPYSGTIVVIVGAIGISLAVLALLVRVYAKVYLFRRITVEDCK